VDPIAAHPAKFTDKILEEIGDVLTPFAMHHLDYHGYRPYRVLDPFGGVGKVFMLEHLIPGDVECSMMELEREWADQSPVRERTYVGDSLVLMDMARVDGVRFDCIVTSPVYGNRMSDHHEARDDSKRHTYRHYLGRALSDNNAGAMQWGRKYRQFHERAWELATALVNPGGLFVLNVSDHIRKGKVERVSLWHVRTLIRLGWHLERAIKIPTPRQRHGENGELRVDGEMVYVLRLPNPAGG
jgi:hypothetical protein